jgi:uncharacterized protein YbjT (DUF2867 family)
MKILVTGATGFVGREVLRQLHAAGHEARVLVRDTKAAADRLPQPSCVTEFHRGDVTDLRSLTGAARGCDAVIHLVGIISEAGSTTFERLHVEATRNLAASTQADGVTRFIHMSALGTRAHAVSRYHQTKWEAEEVVRQSGLRFTVLRPSLIYGPEDHFVNQLLSLSRWMPFLPVMGRGTSLLQPVAVDRVARCFVQALASPESEGQTYDVCGPERLNFTQILDAILKAANRKRFKLRIPLPLARAQAAVLEFILGSCLGTPPPLNRDQLLMLQEDNVGDPGPAERRFRFQQECFQDGIRRYISRGTCSATNKSKS